MPQKSQLKHYILFVYSFTNFSQRDKVKFIRFLFGYKNVKSGKEYIHQGLVHVSGAIKVAQNVIMVPSDNSVLFKSFFNSNKIKVEVKEIWAK